MKHARATLEGLPDFAANRLDASLHALDCLRLLHHGPQSLLATRTLARARERFHQVVDERDRVLRLRARLAQTRLAHGRRASRANKFKGGITRRFIKLVRLF